MNTANLTTRTAANTANTVAAVVTAAALHNIDTAPRYRNRDFGVGYGRSEGYARRHSLWQGAARSRFA